MPLNDIHIADFKQHLRDLPEAELRLGLDTRSINQEWKRSLARMELERREYEKWADRFNAQESAREDAQKFQAAQMVEQLGVAEKQSISAKNAARAAWASAAAAIGLLVLTAFQVFGDTK